MKVAVTGSGASVIGLGLGPEIDACDAVVRVSWQPLVGYEADVGSVNHYWVTDLRPANHAKPDSYSTIREVWVFPPFTFSPETRYGHRNICPDKVIQPVTQAEYMNLYDEIPGRRWPSNGLGAIALALWRLKPDELLLTGFDVLFNPGAVDYRYYWGGEYLAWKCNNHDYQAEHDLALKLLDEAGFECLSTPFAGNRKLRRSRS